MKHEIRHYGLNKIMVSVCFSSTLLMFGYREYLNLRYRVVLCSFDLGRRIIFLICGIRSP